jgi:hypothetical protein
MPLTFEQFEDTVMSVLDEIIVFSFKDLSGYDYSLYTFETGTLGVSGSLDHKGEWSVYSPTLDKSFVGGSLEEALDDAYLAHINKASRERHDQGFRPSLGNL